MVAEHGGPKLVRVDLTGDASDSDAVAQTVLFPTDVALPTTCLDDVRFDLRRGQAGAACITDSSDQGPNGIIVVDLATGESWRRLHEHPSPEATAPPDLRLLWPDTTSVADGHRRRGDAAPRTQLSAGPRRVPRPPLPAAAHGRRQSQPAAAIASPKAMVPGMMP